MSNVIDLNATKVSNLVDQFHQIAAAMNAQTIADAAAMGLAIERVVDSRFRITDADTAKLVAQVADDYDLDFWLEGERDKLAAQLGLCNATTIRRLAAAARGKADHESPEYHRAYRYFTAAVFGEAVPHA